jgi:hypothetical protein
MTCLVNVYIYWRVALELSTPETWKKPYKTTSIHGEERGYIPMEIWGGGERDLTFIAKWLWLPRSSARYTLPISPHPSLFKSLKCDNPSDPSLTRIACIPSHLHFVSSPNKISVIALRDGHPRIPRKQEKYSEQGSNPKLMQMKSSFNLLKT